MGSGTPEDILFAVENGMDMFDCVLPSRNARNGTLFTSRGKVRIKNEKLQDATSGRWTSAVPATPAAIFPGPICATCSCPGRSWLPS